MATQAIPLHPQWRVWGQEVQILVKTRTWQVLADFGDFRQFLRILMSFGDFSKTRTFCNNS
jgi:hypothetical protein